MYENDTFFQLSLPGQVGVVVMSTGLAAVTVWLAWRLGRRAHWPTRVLVALGAFLVFEWLAPQAQYQWYRQVIPDLALQWVIAPWPDPVSAVDTLLFLEAPSLSAHARALLGWGLITLLIWRGRFRPPPTAL